MFAGALSQITGCAARVRGVVYAAAARARATACEHRAWTLLADVWAPVHAWMSLRFGRAGLDAIWIWSLGIAVFFVIKATEADHLFFSFAGSYPELQLEAVIIAGIVMSAGTILFAFRRWRELSNEVAVRLAAERRANELAHSDALTGLHNRRAFTDALTRSIARAERENLSVSVLLLDLDRFKPVNDLFGHIAGDQVLKDVSDRFLEVIRAEEFVARRGGDEFAVLIVHGRQESAVPGQVARRLIDRLDQPFHVGTSEVHVGVSVGIATFPENATDGDLLLRRADVALYRAKENGRGEYRYFEQSMDVQIRERAELETDLRSALTRREIIPHFQPLVDLRTGEIVGFEALARWNRIGHGFVPPDSFISIAEESGHINELSLLILEQACRQARRWDDGLKLSVNISPVQFRDRILAEKIHKVLDDTGLSPHRLEIEITENALVKDLNNARRTLGKLKARGVQVSIDDFGAGYSSLQHLSSLPFDGIKIDRSFVHKLGTTPEAGKIINAIIKLGESLGLSTTGEGIETEAAAKHLREAGCHIGQGWLYGRPLCADAVMALLNERAAARLQLRSA